MRSIENYCILEGMERTGIHRRLQSAAAWLRRHAPKHKEPFTYVAIGDSTVEGYGASDQQHAYASLVHKGISLQFKHAALLNFGKTGARVQDVVENQLSQAVGANPDLITISVGANDIVRSTRLAAFRQEFGNLIRTLRAETQAVIVVTNIPNFAQTPAVPGYLKLAAELRIRRINNVIRSVARQNDLILIDAFQYATMFMRQFPDEVLYEDGFHPSNVGYALWASSILTVLQDKL